MITRESVLKQLREIAEIEQIDLDDEMFDIGVDSVRLMRLSEIWRRSRPHLDFAEVAGARTVSELLVVLDATS